MTPLETSLARAGLEPTGTGLKLSAFGPHWLHDSPLLEDFTLAEADIVGAGMLGARATAGQVLVAEGEVGDWMLVVLSGTVDVTRRIGADLGETVRGWRSSGPAPRSARCRCSTANRVTPVAPPSMPWNSRCSRARRWPR
jgi:hypothetical protein